MQSFVYDALPARVVFGSGTVAQIKLEVQRLGVQRVLILSKPGRGAVTAYHLFYADGCGQPATDITFFNWSMKPEQCGMHCITRTAMRVSSAETLAWWKQHF